MDFAYPIVKPEMRVAGELPVGSDSAISGFDIGGVSDAGKRTRVSRCGFEEGEAVKRVKQGFNLPPGFLDPLPKPAILSPTPLSMRPIVPFSTVRPLVPRNTGRPVASLSPSMVRPVSLPLQQVTAVAKEDDNGCKQFWKAGDYEGPVESSSSLSADIDRVRVHPKFLHSNATSHKWALGALVELLDNSMDEVCNGATFVNIDVLENPKDKTKMLLVEDNGGGMNPNKMRHCMSLGYSMKSKSANTIGQYGNGFKTSTMRIGADVIVLSRCPGKNGMNPTQSIGMLSYTFLRNTRKQDIIVPMVDYEKIGDDWHQMERSSSAAWKTNMDSIVQWSPYCSEADLLQQLNLMFDQGTRVIIYNLWEDDEGQLELDFVTDAQDIQIRGTNRVEKMIEMCKKFPNSSHFLTYQHSLRSYASILYLRLPQGFTMILRGKEIEHHNIVNDMMIKEEKTYRPILNGVSKDLNIFAVVTIGFVKDATNHIDVQGFNVYHKNRLIKPFWRVWNAAGSDGRGVIGVLEANFIEPAHDKQGFERTILLNRLEARLLQIQKNYWSSNCHKIGYAPRRQKKTISNSEDIDSSPEAPHQQSATIKAKAPNVVQSQDSTRNQNSDMLFFHSNHDAIESGSSAKSDELKIYESCSSSKKPQNNGYEKSERRMSFHLPKGRSFISSSNPDGSGPSGTECTPIGKSLDGSEEAACSSLLSSSVLDAGLRQSNVSAGSVMKIMPLSRSCLKDSDMHKPLPEVNKALKERIITVEGKLLHDLQIEREKNKELTKKVELLEKRLKDADGEQETLVNILVEERERMDAEEDKWRNKLKVANDTIRAMENLATGGFKS